MSLESQRSTLRESSPSAERNWLGYVLACMFAFGAFLSGLHFGQQTSNYAVASQPASIFSGLFASEATQAVVDPDTMDLSSFWEVW
ncbi:hypothetical protein KC906_01955, partial [Candidatus Kaiserbacteria bacterium]|nr:hypothetical protein [Candidatus Kaiserbacteria bacterium]